MNARLLAINTAIDKGVGSFSDRLQKARLEYAIDNEEVRAQYEENYAPISWSQFVNCA